MSKSLFTTIIEEVAPTTETVGVVGQLYLDTIEKKLYQCVSITAETVDEVEIFTYEWKEIGSTNEVDLSDYYNKTEVDSLLSNIETGSTFDGDYNSLTNTPDLSIYATNEALNNKAEQTSLDAIINNETQIMGVNNYYPSSPKYSFKAGGAKKASQSREGGISIGYDSFAHDNSIAIGRNARAATNATAYDCVAIGAGSGFSSGVYNDVVCIGTNAKAKHNDVIQLGRGENTISSTLQVFNDNIYNHNTHTLTVQNISLNGIDINTVITNALPTLTSQLTNDSLYITNQVNDLANYYNKNNTYTKTEVDTKIASLIDSAPETLNTLNELAVAVQENDSLIDTLNSAIGTKANQSALESLQTQVNDITVPTKLSDLTDDKGYLTSYTETDPTVPSHVKSITESDITKWNNKVESSALSSYSLTTHNHDAVYSKLDHAHTYSELTDKPTLSTVATSGNYNDLTNKPTLPTKLSDLTNDLNLSSKLEFSTYKNGTDNHYLGVGIAPSDPGAVIMYAVDNGRTYTDGNSLLDALDSETSTLSGIMLTPAGMPLIVSKTQDGLGSW